MEKFKSLFDNIAAFIWVGGYPAWIVIDTQVLHYMTDIVQFFAYLFGAIASLFTATWTAIRFITWVKRQLWERKMRKLHKRKLSKL